MREATLVDGRGATRAHRRRRGLRHLPGSLGRLGVLVEVVVEGAPLAGLAFDTTRHGAAAAST